MAENSSFQKVWTTAFEKYKKDTHRDLRDLRDKSLVQMLGDLNTVEALEREIEIGKQSGGFNKFRAEHRKLADNVRLCFEPLQQAASVINKGLALSPYAPAGAIFGAGLFLIQTAGKQSDAYDWIEALFEQLGEFCTRLGIYTRAEGYMVTNMEKKMTGILTFMLEIFALSEKTVRDGRFKTYLIMAFWKTDDKVKEAVERLNRLMGDEEKLAIAVTFSTVQEMFVLMKAVHANAAILPRVERELQEIRASINPRTVEAAQGGDQAAWQVIVDRLESTGAPASTIDLHKDFIVGRLVTEFWFEQMKTKVRPLLQTSADLKKRNVRIAILDRVDDQREIIDREVLMLASWNQVEKTKSWVFDTKGKTERFVCSGTAGLLLRVAPDAEIFVAYISKDTGVATQATKDNITAALMSVADWAPDIIVMPFGVSHMDREIMEVIRYAHKKNIIMIAAAESDTEGQLSFPACAQEVMAIYYCNQYGRLLTSGPMLTADGPKFAIVGENIRLPFLREACVSGASVAATLAGGLAALVSEFAAQHFDQIPEAVWSQRGMAKMFQLMSPKAGSGLFYLIPWNLLDVDRGVEEIVFKMKRALTE